MNFRPMLVVNGLLIAGMAAISAWGWQAIPDGALVPAHVGLDGNVDRFTDKNQFLMSMPAIGLGLTALLWSLPHFDPRRANIEASSKFWNAASILSVGMLAYVHALLVVNAAGTKIDIVSSLVPGLSVLFIGLGNYLGKTRSNWFGGVRTPWSLSSEYSWEKTHRWSGRMMVASGLAGLVAWHTLDAKAALLTLICAAIATAAIGVALSYFFWRADPKRMSNGA